MFDHKIQRLSDSLEVSQIENLESGSRYPDDLKLSAATTRFPAESQRTIAAASITHPSSSQPLVAIADKLPAPNNVSENRTKVSSELTQGNHGAWESRAFQVALAADELLGEFRPEPISDLPNSSPVKPPSPEDQNRYLFNAPWISAIEFAITDLASRLDVKVGKINLFSFEQVVWSDGSIGCPKPGYGYTMALVDGYRIRLELDGELFSYHGSIRKNEFYRDNEFFNLPDTVHDPIYCEDPWPAHSDFGQRSREELPGDSGRLTLDTLGPVGASHTDQLSIALIRDDAIPGLIAPG